jgi:phosphoserine phosphatase
MAGFAFFDLDHTILPHDTQGLFCNYVLRRRPWRVVLHLGFLPFACLRAAGLVSTVRAKRAFMSYLWGMSASEMACLANDFAKSSVLPWCYPEVMAEVQRHRMAGRTLILNTASPDYYGGAIAQVLGFDHCVATVVTTGAAFPLHPRIAVNNKRGQKIVAMQALLPAVAAMTESDRAESWAYSDSAADLPLLEFAGHGVMIHPATALAEVGGRKQWSTLLPSRPYKGKWGNLWAMMRQLLGLYRECPVRR